MLDEKKKGHFQVMEDEDDLQYICAWCADGGTERKDEYIPKIGDRFIFCPECEWGYHEACFEKHYKQEIPFHPDEDRLDEEYLIYHDGDERKELTKPGPIHYRDGFTHCEWIRWMDYQHGGYGI